MDFRIWEPKEDGYTKNDHFREMLKNAKRKGMTPMAVVADSWYSSLDNVKCIRDLGWNWLMGLKKNRIVNRGQKLEDLDIPNSGLKVHLKRIWMGMGIPVCGQKWPHGLLGHKSRTTWPERNNLLDTKTLENRSLSPRAQTNLWSGNESGSHEPFTEKPHCVFGIELD